jgi:hypothetical protein
VEPAPAGCAGRRPAVAASALKGGAAAVAPDDERGGRGRPGPAADSLEGLLLQAAALSPLLRRKARDLLSAPPPPAVSATLLLGGGGGGDAAAAAARRPNALAGGGGLPPASCEPELAMPAALGTRGAAGEGGRRDAAGAAVGSGVWAGGVKGAARAMEKLLRSYECDPARLTDVCREVCAHARAHARLARAHFDGPRCSEQERTLVCWGSLSLTVAGRRWGWERGVEAGGRGQRRKRRLKRWSKEARDQMLGRVHESDIQWIPSIHILTVFRTRTQAVIFEEPAGVLAFLEAADRDPEVTRMLQCSRLATCLLDFLDPVTRQEENITVIQGGRGFYCETCRISDSMYSYISGSKSMCVHRLIEGSESVQLNYAYAKAALLTCSATARIATRASVRSLIPRAPRTCRMGRSKSYE